MSDSIIKFDIEIRSRQAQDITDYKRAHALLSLKLLDFVKIYWFEAAGSNDFTCAAQISMQ